MKCQYCVWERLGSETWSWQVWLEDDKWVNEALVFWRSSQDVPALAYLDSSVLCHTCFSHQRPALHQMAKIWHPELPYWAINSILFKQSSPADRVRWGFFLKLRVFFYLFYNTWEQYYFSEPPTLSLTSLKCSELLNSNKTIFANSAIYKQIKI